MGLLDLRCAGAILLLSGGTAAADESPHALTANVGLYSQYVFRGLAQTNERPSIQGGADYAHASGFDAGYTVLGKNLGDDPFVAGMPRSF